MIGLADCNNFFVSCERSLDPSLEGRPVVVLSNNDGCAIARSNEAKKLGIRMGQPAFELREHIQSGRLIALSGNHLLYRDMSLRVHTLFRRFVPATIDYSIDESFLDFTGIPQSELLPIAAGIRDACRREMNIPVSIGIAPTKTLAKIVCHTVKHSSEGIGIMTTMDEATHAMASLPIGKLWGLGRRLTHRLASEGIYTVLQFYQRPQMWIRSHLGVCGERSWLELHGTSCIDLNHIKQDLQDSVSETRTFPFDTDSYDYIRARIAIYTADCARRLRAMRGQCDTVTVFLRSNRFHTEKGYYAPQGSIHLSRPLADTPLLVKAGIECLKEIIIPGVRYKRAGVLFTGITRVGPVTPSLFDGFAACRDAWPVRQKDTRLMRTIDRLNSDVGAPCLRLASQLTTGHPGHNDGYSSSFQAPDRLR